MTQFGHLSRTPRRDTRTQQRLTSVAELYVQGWTQSAIGERLGLTQPRVSKDLSIIRAQWRGSMIRNFDEAVARELEKIDRVEREAWQAWEDSKAPQESTLVMDGQGGKRAQKRVKHQPGDPRFLDQIQKCISARRAVLGLDAPTRIAPVTPDGEQTYHAGVMAELMRLAECSRGGPQVIDTLFIEQQLAAAAHTDEVTADDREETDG